MCSSKGMNISDPKDTSGKVPRPDQRPEQAERRGSPAAPSDKPEGDTPHPQDVNDIAR